MGLSFMIPEPFRRGFGKLSAITVGAGSGGLGKRFGGDQVGGCQLEDQVGGCQLGERPRVATIWSRGEP